VPCLGRAAVLFERLSRTLTPAGPLRNATRGGPSLCGVSRLGLGLLRLDAADLGAKIANTAAALAL
jgi:hypothetical protein